jgi:hypothetical protein
LLSAPRVTRINLSLCITSLSLQWLDRKFSLLQASKSALSYILIHRRIARHHAHMHQIGGERQRIKSNPRLVLCSPDAQPTCERCSVSFPRQPPTHPKERCFFHAQLALSLLPDGKFNSDDSRSDRSRPPIRTPAGLNF